MSALIRQMVARKRLAVADETHFINRRERIIAQAMGAKGDTGPMPDHEWKGSKLRFEKPDGTWGEYVDLKGKPGKDGERVVVFAGGGSNSRPLDALQPGVDGVEPASIAVMQAGEWVNLPWAAFVTTIAGAIDMTSEKSRRTDFVGDTLLYRGEADPGAPESAAVWRIRRIEFASDGDVTETWAGGSTEFKYAWDDRANLSYL